jgi:cellobiose-specific phosphotransferase system component IIA|tara:strand:+ start:197 stop:334 length:138 start_codon:yes stop_codon:yes gene_type:complete
MGNSGEAKQLYEKAKRALKDSKTKQNEGVIQEAFKNLSEACNKDS